MYFQFIFSVIIFGLLSGRGTLQLMSDYEKTIQSSQFITVDKNKHFSFLSSIILDLFYDGIHSGQHQIPRILPLI
jgi:mannose-6-phosphate isomerase-like protein (cupin superfamily)